VINTSAITAVTKSSMKCRYCKSSPTQQWRKEWRTKENKGRLCDVSIGAAAVGEKACLGTK